MVKSILEKLGIHDEVKKLINKLNLFDFSYKVYLTYPSIVIEFLATDTFRYSKVNEENPLYRMKLKLREQNRFMTSREFNDFFRFPQGEPFKPHPFGGLINFGTCNPNQTWAILLQE